MMEKKRSDKMFKSKLTAGRCRIGPEFGGAAVGVSVTDSL
jgi:hypothetical protein